MFSHLSSVVKDFKLISLRVFFCFPVHEYVESLKNAADLVDRLANPQDSSVRILGFDIHVIKLLLYFQQYDK